MDEGDIRLIRESFAGVAAIAGPAAILFHGRLFRLDPTTRPVFAEADMRAQGARFIAALGEAVTLLDQPDRLRPAARGLARRLAARGLRREHRCAIGEALIWMLEECLAEEFSPEAQAAWQRAYEAVWTEAMELAPAV